MYRIGRTSHGWFIVLCILALVCFSLVPVLQRVRQNSSDARAAKCLATIGMALISYYHEHGSYPPAYIADATGRPKHSWRVLLLPYLGYY